MSNVLPTFFIVLAALALLVTLLALWHSLRHALAQRSAVTAAASALVSPERAALLAEKQSLLVALKDLEAEREAGKLSNADFRDLNEQYRTRARDVLRQLDVMLAPHRSDAKALLSSATAAASGVAMPLAKPEREFGAARRCESCSADNDADAVFCKRCGTRLQAGVPG